MGWLLSIEWLDEGAQCSACATGALQNLAAVLAISTIALTGALLPEVVTSSTDGLADRA
jgi:hypothetical protein